MAYPGGRKPDLKVPVTQVAAYAPPRKVETPKPTRGIEVDPDDMQAFARPNAPQGVMPAPGLPIGGHPKAAECAHPYTGPRGGDLRWVDTATDLEGCLACGKTRTAEGWALNNEWTSAAVAAGVLF